MTKRFRRRHGDLVEVRDWTGAELAEARRLRRDGKGSTYIGKKLGRTRNSVIGALHRAGEPGLRSNQLFWLRRAVPARHIPLRFSEQTDVS